MLRVILPERYPPIVIYEFRSTRILLLLTPNDPLGYRPAWLLSVPPGLPFPTRLHALNRVQPKYAIGFYIPPLTH
jgi:hypothetical protein